MHFDKNYQSNIKAIEVFNFHLASIATLILIIILLFVPIQVSVRDVKIVRPIVFNIVDSVRLRSDSKITKPISLSKSAVLRRKLPAAPLDYKVGTPKIAAQSSDTNTHLHSIDQDASDSILSSSKQTNAENHEITEQNTGPHSDQNSPLTLIYETDLSLDYPEFALRQRIEGKVGLRIFVQESGLVEKIDVLYASSSVLAKHALRHVANWRFAPVQTGRSQDIVISYRIEGQSVTYN